MNRQNICHRSICLENIMFVDKERKKVKVIGFSSATETLRPFNERFGSLLYMAPEIFIGNYDKRVDIWSLGVVIYTMVTGF